MDLSYRIFSLDFNEIQKDTSSLSKTFCVLVITAILVYTKCFSRLTSKSFWKKKDLRTFDVNEIPGPKPSWIPLLGVIPEVLPLRNSLKIVLGWSQQYGDIFKASVGLETLIILNSGVSVNALLKSPETQHVPKLQLIYDVLKPFIKNAVVVSKGGFWKQQRKVLMRSVISYQSIRGYMPMLNKHSQRFINKLETVFADEKLHTINEEINVCFCEILSELMTGMDMHNTEGGAIFNSNLQKWKATLINRLINPWLLFEPLWKLDRRSGEQQKLVDAMNNFTQNLISDHRRRRETESKLDSGIKLSQDGSYGDGKRCMLDDLVEEGLQDAQIVDELNFMMIAGQETSSTAVHFFCFLMALNPHCQEKCREEIDEVFATSDVNANGVTFENLNEFKYLEWCIMEALRLFPPIFAFGRKLESPLLIDENMTLPMGTNVIVSPWLLHRRSKYFPSPDEFDPLRFSPEVCTHRQGSVYIPFSGGLRNCFGFKFAMMQLKMTASYIMRNFELTTTDKMDDVAVLPNFILTPERDYNFMMKKRKIKE